MDVDADPCGSDNFYGEIASFMPQSGDYSLDDLDEILRSAESQLDGSFDFSSLVPPSVSDFDVEAFGSPTQHGLGAASQDERKFSFSAFPSPATSNQSDCTSSYNTSHSQRSLSTSSIDGEHFNPDEFINFFVDDDVKIEELDAPSNDGDTMPRRSTPSPTGSCSSSGGSSTSGVQSDVSSVVSVPSIYADTTFAVADDVERGLHTASAPVAVAPAVTVMAPLSVPNLSASASTPAATSIMQPLPQVQPMTLIPVKTVLAVNVQPVSNVNVASVPIVKAKPTLAPKVLTTTIQPAAKVITPAVHNATAQPTAGAASAAGAKVTPPPNAKPKTIFLSSKDFKALMQKMNTNGGVGKGAKITGGLNGQMPKIIMKTANGKVITANKLVQPLKGNNSNAATTPQTHPSQQQHSFVPKVVKSNEPLVIKQHHAQHSSTKFTTMNHAAAIAAARASSSSAMPDLSIYKGIVDDKMFKKQQRMIKNRESASLSRKKKKEYVVSLESRINNLEKENYTLKGENTSLRSQLAAFAQTCQCKHSNISEFILNSLNISTKVQHSNDHSVSLSAPSEHCYRSEHHHVKIAPKPAPKSLKQRMTATNVRKNVAVLFAMAFMVTLNVGNFQTYFNKNSIESTIEAAGDAAAAAAAANSAETLPAGRQLLWVESETEFTEKLHRSKRETELEVPPPPLHFLRPINRTASFGNGTAHEPPINCTSTDTGCSNQTEENIRLVHKLHKWIDGNDYLNLSLHEKFGNDLDNSVGFKLTSDYLDWETLELQNGPSAKQKRKMFIQQPSYERKQRKLETHKDVDNGNDSGSDNDNNHRNSLDLFKPKLSEEYIRLFRGIKRQDDTFYVLSFNMDHILLPASVYNKSARPKMSLMLPAGDPTGNGDIVLMQIDCEVVNTTELELKSHMIPEKLRPNKYKNNHFHPNSTDVANNETRATREVKSQQRSSYMPTATPSRVERAPAPRTYFMGPKTQAAMKKRPTIVKLSGNDSLANIVTLNMKNSTLFAKMRETVEAEATP